MSGGRETQRFDSVLSRFDNHFGWYYLPVSEEIGQGFEYKNGTRRVVCTLNGTISKQCALIPFSAGGFFVVVDKRIRTKLGIIEGDTVEVELAADTSKYGLPLAEEFAEVLRQDPEGDRLFHSLTAGKQRSLIYLVGKTKNIDRRIHIALCIIEHLKETDGTIEPERLADAIKRLRY